MLLNEFWYKSTSFQGQGITVSGNRLATHECFHNFVLSWLQADILQVWPLLLFNNLRSYKGYCRILLR